ncbi:GyrI-like domain-containing protein [Mesobacterium pallidum]|uniref:GyrI-like domain-containing protein n=1 Tax=Mesobacterium pallidum TaxID=2872037 RepID=UPI001EE2A732|nr:GyrI-like domain-containing protein [Mesobacterium pallidum]
MSDSRPDPEIVEAAPRLIVATSRDYTMDTRHEIPAQFQGWFAAGHEIPEAVGDAIFGVSYNADGQGAFSYGVGVEVEGRPATLPDGTCILTTASGPHAVLRVFGPVTDLPGNFDWLFSTWMPEHGKTPRAGAVFERYPDDPRNGPDGMAYEIWAPIQP